MLQGNYNKHEGYALQEVKFEFSLQKMFGEPFHHSFVKYEIFRQDIFKNCQDKYVYGNQPFQSCSRG